MRLHSASSNEASCSL